MQYNCNNNNNKKNNMQSPDDNRKQLNFHVNPKWNAFENAKLAAVAANYSSSFPIQRGPL